MSLILQDNKSEKVNYSILIKKKNKYITHHPIKKTQNEVKDQKDELSNTKNPECIKFVEDNSNLTEFDEETNDKKFLIEPEKEKESCLKRLKCKKIKESQVMDHKDRNENDDQKFDNLDEDSKSEKLANMLKKSLMKRILTRLSILILLIVIIPIIIIICFELMTLKGSYSINTPTNIDITLENCNIKFKDQSSSIGDILLDYKVPTVLAIETDSKAEMTFMGSNYTFSFINPNPKADCLITVYVPQNQTMASLTINCAGSYCNIIQESEKLVVTDEINMQGETMYANFRYLETGKLNFEASSGLIQLNALTLTSSSTSNVNMTTKGDIIIQSLENLNVEAYTINQAFCFAAPAVDLISTTDCAVSGQPTTDMNVNLTSCNSNYNLCKTAGCTPISKIIVRAASSNIYANLIASLDSPVEATSIAKGQIYEKGIGLDQELITQLQKINELTDLNSANTPVLLADFGNFASQSSNFKRYILSTNPSYTYIKPWWLATFSAGLLTTQQYTIDSNLLPGFCPYYPVYTIDKLYDIQQLLYDAVTSKAPLISIVSEQPSISVPRIVPNSTGIFKLEISRNPVVDTWYSISKRENGVYSTTNNDISKNGFAFSAVIISLVIAVYSSFLIMKVINFGMNYIYEEIVNKVEHLHNYQALSQAFDETQKRRVELTDNLGDKIKNYKLSKFLKNSPSVCAYLDYLTEFIYKQFIDSAADFYRYLFKKVKIADVDYENFALENEMISGTEMKQLYEKFCFLNNYIEEKLDDENVLKYLNQRGYKLVLDKKNTKMILYKIILKERTNFKPDPNSQKESLASFINHCVERTEFEEDFIEFDDFKVHYRNFCSKNYLPPQDVNLAILQGQHNLFNKALPKQIITKDREKSTAQDKNFTYIIDKKRLADHFLLMNDQYLKLGNKRLEMALKIYIEFDWWYFWDLIVVVLHISAGVALSVPILFIGVLNEISYTPFSLRDPSVLLKLSDLMYSTGTAYEKLFNGYGWNTFFIIACLVFWSLWILDMFLHYLNMKFPEHISFSKNNKSKHLLWKISRISLWLLILIFISIYIGYLMLVAQWLLLGAILNPDLYLPYASGAVTFITFLITKYKKFKSLGTSSRKIILDYLKKLFLDSYSSLMNTLSKSLSNKGLKIVEDKLSVLKKIDLKNFIGHGVYAKFITDEEIEELNDQIKKLIPEDLLAAGKQLVLEPSSIKKELVKLQDLFMKKIQDKGIELIKIQAGDFYEFIEVIINHEGKKNYYDLLFDYLEKKSHLTSEVTSLLKMVIMPEEISYQILISKLLEAAYRKGLEGNANESFPQIIEILVCILFKKDAEAKKLMFDLFKIPSYIAEKVNQISEFNISQEELSRRLDWVLKLCNIEEFESINFVQILNSKQPKDLFAAIFPDLDIDEKRSSNFDRFELFQSLVSCIKVGVGIEEQILGALKIPAEFIKLILLVMSLKMNPKAEVLPRIEALDKNIVADKEIIIILWIYIARLYPKKMREYKNKLLKQDFISKIAEPHNLTSSELFGFFDFINLDCESDELDQFFAWIFKRYSFDGKYVEKMKYLVFLLLDKKNPKSELVLPKALIKLNLTLPDQRSIVERYCFKNDKQEFKEIIEKLKNETNQLEKMLKTENSEGMSLVDLLFMLLEFINQEHKNTTLKEWFVNVGKDVEKSIFNFAHLASKSEYNNYRVEDFISTYCDLETKSIISTIRYLNSYDLRYSFLDKFKDRIQKVFSLVLRSDEKIDTLTKFLIDLLFYDHVYSGIGRITLTAYELLTKQSSSNINIETLDLLLPEIIRNVNQNISSILKLDSKLPVLLYDIVRNPTEQKQVEMLFSLINDPENPILKYISLHKFCFGKKISIASGSQSSLLAKTLEIHKEGLLIFDLVGLKDFDEFYKTSMPLIGRLTNCSQNDYQTYKLILSQLCDADFKEYESLEEKFKIDKKLLEGIKYLKEMCEAKNFGKMKYLLEYIKKTEHLQSFFRSIGIENLDYFYSIMRIIFADLEDSEEALSLLKSLGELDFAKDAKKFDVKIIFYKNLKPIKPDTTSRVLSEKYEKFRYNSIKLKQRQFSDADFSNFPDNFLKNLFYVSELTRGCSVALEDSCFDWAFPKNTTQYRDLVISYIGFINSCYNPVKGSINDLSKRVFGFFEPKTSKEDGQKNCSIENSLGNLCKTLKIEPLIFLIFLKDEYTLDQITEKIPKVNKYFLKYFIEKWGFWSKNFSKIFLENKIRNEYGGTNFNIDCPRPEEEDFSIRNHWPLVNESLINLYDGPFHFRELVQKDFKESKISSQSAPEEFLKYLLEKNEIEVTFDFQQIFLDVSLSFMKMLSQAFDFKQPIDLMDLSLISELCQARNYYKSGGVFYMHDLTVLERKLFLNENFYKLDLSVLEFFSMLTLKKSDQRYKAPAPFYLNTLVSVDYLELMDKISTNNDPEWKKQEIKKYFSPEQNNESEKIEYEEKEKKLSSLAKAYYGENFKENFEETIQYFGHLFQRSRLNVKLNGNEHIIWTFDFMTNLFQIQDQLLYNKAPVELNSIEDFMSSFYKKTELSKLTPLFEMMINKKDNLDKILSSIQIPNLYLSIFQKKDEKGQTKEQRKEFIDALCQEFGIDEKVKKILENVANLYKSVKLDATLKYLSTLLSKSNSPDSSFAALLNLLDFNKIKTMKLTNSFERSEMFKKVDIKKTLKKITTRSITKLLRDNFEENIDIIHDISELNFLSLAESLYNGNVGILSLLDPKFSINSENNKNIVALRFLIGIGSLLNSPSKSKNERNKNLIKQMAEDLLTFTDMKSCFGDLDKDKCLLISKLLLEFSLNNYDTIIEIIGGDKCEFFYEIIELVTSDLQKLDSAKLLKKFLRILKILIDPKEYNKIEPLALKIIDQNFTQDISSLFNLKNLLTNWAKPDNTKPLVLEGTYQDCFVILDSLIQGDLLSRLSHGIDEEILSIFKIIIAYTYNQQTFEIPSAEPFDKIISLVKDERKKTFLNILKNFVQLKADPSTKEWDYARSCIGIILETIDDKDTKQLLETFFDLEQSISNSKKQGSEQHEMNISHNRKKLILLLRKKFNLENFLEESMIEALFEISKYEKKELAFDVDHIWSLIKRGFPKIEIKPEIFLLFQSLQSKDLHNSLIYTFRIFCTDESKLKLFEEIIEKTRLLEENFKKFLQNPFQKLTDIYKITNNAGDDSLNIIMNKIQEGKATIKELYDLVDKSGDNNGYISQQEFKKLALRLQIRLSDHRLTEIFARVKKNTNSSTIELNLQEFTKALEYLQEKNLILSLQFLGVSPEILTGIFIQLIIWLLFLLVFVFLGIQAFALGGSFGAVINSIFPAAAGLGLGQKDSNKEKISETAIEKNAEKAKYITENKTL